MILGLPGCAIASCWANVAIRESETLRTSRKNPCHNLIVFAVVLASAASFSIGSAAQVARQQGSDQSSTFQILRRMVLPGDESARSLAFDSASRRLYVGRRSRITVLDGDSGNAVGEIPNTGEVSALALARGLGRGFASTAHNTLVVFDLSSLREIGSLSIPGKDPNHLTYDPSTKRVFVMNNRSQSVVAVSAERPSVLGTIPLVDDPEAAVADGSGHLYVVLADPAEIAVIDTSRLTLLQRIQLSPCNEPRGIRMDVDARRLFVGCSNGLLAVADPDLGRLIARLVVEANSADVSFDSRSNLLFLGNPAGIISVVSQRFPDRYRVVSAIRTGSPIADAVVDSAQHHLLVAVTLDRPRGNSQKAKAPASMIVTIGTSEKNSADRGLPNGQP